MYCLHILYRKYQKNIDDLKGLAKYMILKDNNIIYKSNSKYETMIYIDVLDMKIGKHGHSTLGLSLELNER